MESKDQVAGPATYVVIAYRMGETNNHQYVVFAGTDRSAAVQAAQDECEGRGLKYGVEVVAWPAQQRCAYFPSFAEAREASGPVESAAKIAEQAIGNRVLQAFKEGTRYAPSGERAVAPSGESYSPLIKVPVVLPDWLNEACTVELELAHRLAGS